MDTPKTIYIADDDDNIRLAIKTFLRNDGYQVEDFPTGDLLFEAFREKEADLVILDVMMPGSSGFEICQKLREVSTVPIIMLTARDSEMDYATGLSLGSDDYFTKPFSPMALVMRVRAIFRRIEFERKKNEKSEEDSIEAGRLIIDTRSHKVTNEGEELQLTPNEYDLLCYLAARKGQAVSRDELLENIWGYQSDVETRATDDTVRRLRRKLEGTGLQIEAVWGFGFRLTEEK